MKNNVVHLVTVFIIYVVGMPQAHSQDQAGQRFADIPRGVPVVMLNMLKFRDDADYGDNETKMTGREAYDVYRAGASKLVAKVNGNRVWIGNVKTEIIAPEGEEWDEVFLVRYPSIEAFIGMVSSEAYQKVVIHRTAALEDSRLIAMVEKE